MENIIMSSIQVITFRQLQRMTVKELLELIPVEVTVDGEIKFRIEGVEDALQE